MITITGVNGMWRGREGGRKMRVQGDTGKQVNRCTKQVSQGEENKCQGEFVLP